MKLMRWCGVCDDHVNGIYIARDIHIHVIIESGSHLMLVGHIMAWPF